MMIDGKIRNQTPSVDESCDGKHEYRHCQKYFHPSLSESQFSVLIILWT